MKGGRNYSSFTPGAYHAVARRALQSIGALRLGVKTISGQEGEAEQSLKLSYVGMCIELERFFCDVLRRTDSNYQTVQGKHKDSWEHNENTHWVKSNWSSVHAFTIDNQTLGQLWGKVKRHPEVKGLGQAFISRIDIIIANRNGLAHKGKFEEKQDILSLYEVLRQLITAFEPSLNSSTDIA